MEFWQSAEFDDHEQVCLLTDAATGLRAIVAIHSTALGPAAGGTRFKSYETDGLALDDALRLSRAMSYKSALAGLPCGGGKAVIIGDPDRVKSKPLLHAYGRFINRMNGLFATGEDVGVSVADIDVIGEVSRFVGGTSRDGDTAACTADGYLHGLEAVIEHRFARRDCHGLRVAVQGLGAVGWGIAERLHARGAALTVADVREERVREAVRAFAACAATPQNIHAADVDVFAPCALGGILTANSVIEIRASAVAGAANNQLATPQVGKTLAARGVLFAPDYVINAGGIIGSMEAYYQAHGRDASGLASLPVRLAAIGTRLREIFTRARRDAATPECTAEAIAREIIDRPRG
ncbi:MAG TPA: Glu/Leu/Phe/Val dehydrogenase dimerization domain-containing protein [Steroidobacteraceae bacterium]|jgi:leucine dehydrogenase